MKRGLKVLMIFVQIKWYSQSKGHLNKAKEIVKSWIRFWMNFWKLIARQRKWLLSFLCLEKHFTELLIVRLYMSKSMRVSMKRMRCKKKTKKKRMVRLRVVSQLMTKMRFPQCSCIPWAVEWMTSKWPMVWKLNSLKTYTLQMEVNVMVR